MMEKETKIKRITIKRERNEGDPCGICGYYFSCLRRAKMSKNGLGIRFVWF